MSYTSLDNLSPLHVATIAGTNSNLPDTVRLTELGFTRGSEIYMLRKSPLGDPIAYMIKGTIIALRRKDARNIIITNIRERDST